MAVVTFKVVNGSWNDETTEDIPVVLTGKEGDTLRLKADQIVDKDSRVTKHADPAAEGFSFGGWFKEKECTNAWNFDTDTVISNTTLFAKG